MLQRRPNFSPGTQRFNLLICETIQQLLVFLRLFLCEDISEGSTQIGIARPVLTGLAT